MEDKEMTNKRDYTGKVVYMGIDVHKKTYCCVSVCEGEVVKRDTMPSNPEGLLTYIHKFFPGAKIQTAYEAGFSGFHLHRYLIGNEINNIVVHPASIEVSARDRVKTDKRDALKIAVQLSAHRLKGIFVPSLEQESKRSVSRLRTNFWQLRQQVGARFKSLLATQGLINRNDDTRLSQKWITQKLLEIEKGNYQKDFLYSARFYAKEWEDLTEKLKEIRKELKKQAEGEKSIQAIYESVPGIGLIHGRELANELGDMRQFRNEKKLFSYTGLTPSEHSSGEHVRQGHISRQGRAVLRKILVEASWVAIDKDPSLREVYNRLSHRGGKRAIVGVARRLVGRIRSCLLNGILYEIKSEKEEIIVQEMICATS
jgi:transposase